MIVNCAGRTRSLIGAQSLINAGLPNRVVALRNGSIGWTLAGQALERGQSRRYVEPSEIEEREALRMAGEVAYRAGVRRLKPGDLDDLASDTERTLYRFDVRQADEFAAGHLAGFVNAPGGQLVQETDHAAPVRGARIVLADPRGARADMTASWLAQVGWEVYVLRPLVLTSPDDLLARFAAPEIAALIGVAAHVLEGGTQAWTRAGLALETGLVRAASAPEDVYKRPYEGTDNAAEAMQAYLDWEFGLVDQLARDGAHGFVVI